MSFGTSTQPTETQVANIQDQQLSANQQAVPVPYVAGTRKVSVTWISNVNNVAAIPVSSGGGKKSASGSSQFFYVGNGTGAVCLGPVDELVSIIQDGSLVWPPYTGVWALGKVIAANQLFLYNSIVWKALVAHTAASANAPDGVNGATYWTEYSLAKGATDYNDITVSNTVQGQMVYGTIRFYWGTQTVADPSLPKHPAYKGISYLILLKFPFGLGKTTPPNIDVVVRRYPRQTIIAGAPATLSAGQANLAAVQAELMTDKNCLGLPPSQLLAPAAQETANTLHNNVALAACSVLLDTQETMRSITDKLFAITDGYTRFNPAAKQIEMGLFDHGMTPNSYTTISVNDLAERPGFKASGWSDVKTRAVVNFTDRAFAYQQVSEKSDDARAYNVIGETRAMTLDRPWITRRNQALVHAAETLRTIGRPQMQGDLSIRREKGRNIRPGDYVLLDFDLEPGGASIFQYCRVIDRTIPKEGPIKFTVLAENSMAPIYVSDSDTADMEVSNDLTPISQVRMLPDDFGISGDSQAVIILAERPDLATIGIQIFFDVDPNGQFVCLGETRKFAAKGTLGSYLESDWNQFTFLPSDTTIDTSLLGVSPGAVGASNDELLAILILTDANGNIAEDPCGREIIEACSISNQQMTLDGWYLTVNRARLNTNIWNWNPSNQVEVWIIRKEDLCGFTSAFFGTIRSNRIAGTAPAVGYFRLTPFTGLQTLPLSAASSVPMRLPLKAPEGPVVVMGTTITNGTLTTHQRLSHAATTIAFAVVSPKDVFIGWFGLWLIPQGGTFNEATPTLWYNIVTGQKGGTQSWGTTDFGSFSNGISAAYLGIGTAATIATPSDLTRFQKIPLTIPAAGNYTLIVQARDYLGLRCPDMPVMTIVAT